ncbi:hypothetical protein ACFL00_01220 [Pseudomonadota bacterium]
MLSFGQEQAAIIPSAYRQTNDSVVVSAKNGHRPQERVEKKVRSGPFFFELGLYETVLLVIRLSHPVESFVDDASAHKKIGPTRMSPVLIQVKMSAVSYSADSSKALIAA